MARLELPYSLTFDMRVTRVERPNVLEGEAIGELMGSGCWTLSVDAASTHIRYNRNVRTTRKWNWPLC